MGRTMVFHHPHAIQPNGKSGDRIRPYQMVRAFEELGYSVKLVTGYGAQRKRAIQRIQQEVLAGLRIDFAYAETSTMPMLLTERHNLPLYPQMDFRFFRWLRSRGTPTGLFYRDLHWRFEQFKHHPWWKRAIMLPLYQFEWHEFQRSVDYLFLPSLPMRSALPTPWPEERVVALPPGAQVVEHHWSPESGRLRALYVGGVTPPLYDLRPMFKAATDADPGLQVTLCCRRDEWQENREVYAPVMSRGIQVVHAQGGGLLPLYEKADIFLMGWNPNPYLGFAMPVKLFEALGHGVPIVTIAGTQVAQFVAENDAGWVVNTTEELVKLVSYLAKHQDEIAAKRRWVQELRLQHTWGARAQAVGESLRAGGDLASGGSR